MIYTGYTYEELTRNDLRLQDWDKLLQYGNILVDGPFMQDQHDYLTKFKGSKNQRIIDLDKTRLAGEIVLWRG